MHTQKSSIENHDTRRTVTKEILSWLCPDEHDEHDWNHAVSDFVQVNFAEIEARVVQHHLENRDDFDALVNGHSGTIVL